MQPGMQVLDLLNAVNDHYRASDILDDSYWSGGYELGIAFPPDWVGPFIYDLAQLVDVIVGESAPIAMIGHSFGGSITSQYAAIFPDRVERLVNIEGFGPPPELMKRWSETPMHEQTRTCRPQRPPSAASLRLRS